MAKKAIVILLMLNIKFFAKFILKEKSLKKTDEYVKDYKKNKPIIPKPNTIYKSPFWS